MQSTISLLTQITVRDIYILYLRIQMLLGYGNSIEKLGIDIIDNLASLPPVSVFGLLLMVISFSGIALQMANICKYILVI